MPVTIAQLVKRPRKTKKKKTNSILAGNPFVKAVVVKAYTTTPKKPNSAMRKVCLVRKTITERIGKRSKATKTKSVTAIVYIPGIGHNIGPHSNVLISKKAPKDLNGVNYSVVKGRLDAAGENGAIQGQGATSGVKTRTRSRSKYGAKRVDLRAKKK